jgi:hypothetical protein
MIIFGVTRPKLVNPKQIVSLELKPGRVTAFVRGSEDNDGDIKVTDLNVREPWTVVVRTATETHYMNEGRFEDALDVLLWLCGRIDPLSDIQTIKKEMQKTYGYEENSK